ncbi:MAG: RDD family protein [Anaerolineae bacterium]
MSDFNYQFGIETPENLMLHAPLAGFGSRCVAAILDNLIIGVGMLIFAIAYLFPSLRRGAGTETLVFIGVMFLVTGLYHLVFELFWNGQTPGKHWTGLRVIRANGLPLTPTAAIVRNFVRLFDFLPIAYGVGLVFLFVTRKTQRLGDLAAGTVVIQEQRAVTIENLQAKTFVKYRRLSLYSPLSEYINITSLTTADVQLVIDFLNRRDALGYNSLDLAILMASQMATKMNVNTSTTGILSSLTAAELFLEQIVRAYELQQYEAKP